MLDTSNIIPVKHEILAYLGDIVIDIDTGEVILESEFSMIYNTTFSGLEVNKTYIFEDGTLTLFGDIDQNVISHIKNNVYEIRETNSYIEPHLYHGCCVFDETIIVNFVMLSTKVNVPGTYLCVFKPIYIQNSTINFPLLDLVYSTINTIKVPIDFVYSTGRREPEYPILKIRRVGLDYIVLPSDLELMSTQHGFLCPTCHIAYKDMKCPLCLYHDGHQDNPVYVYTSNTTQLTFYMQREISDYNYLNSHYSFCFITISSVYCIDFIH
jgi:hypothetical protein